MRHIRVMPNTEKLEQAVATYVGGAASQVIMKQGRFTVAFSGGSTQPGLYKRLASGAFAKHLDWSRVHIFWSDERCVPPSNEHSNYRLAAEALITHVPIPKANVHRIKGEIPPEEAAAEYERDLRDCLGAQVGFDLVVLGLGEDGHTASLFPSSPAVEEGERWAVAVAAPDIEPRVPRVTLTLPVINASNRIAFIVTGASKNAIVGEILAAADDSRPRCPAALVKPKGEIMWFLDQAAGQGVRT